MNGSVEAHDFEPIFVHRAGFRRIYVDLPGMGSTPAGNVQSLDDIFLQIVHLIDNTLRTSDFLLIGSSCGAYLARAVSYKYRNQVQGLLLRVPLVEPESNKRDLDPFKQLVSSREAAAGLSSRDNELLGELLIETPAYIAALKAKLELEHQANQDSDQVALTRIRNDRERYRLSYLAPGLFLAPTLILCGRQDEVVGYRDALHMLELYPRATFAVLDRGTHNLPVLEQDVFKELVRDWLDRVQEWRANRPD